jgi:hypothetical protein
MISVRVESHESQPGFVFQPLRGPRHLAYLILSPLKGTAEGFNIAHVRGDRIFLRCEYQAIIALFSGLIAENDNSEIQPSGYFLSSPVRRLLRSSSSEELALKCTDVSYEYERGPDNLDLLDALFKVGDTIAYSSDHNPALRKLLDSSIECLNLSKEDTNGLKNLEVGTIRQLISLSLSDLEVCGFSQPTIKRMREALAEKNLRFDMKRLDLENWQPGMSVPSEPSAYSPVLTLLRPKENPIRKFPL